MHTDRERLNAPDSGRIRAGQARGEAVEVTSTSVPARPDAPGMGRRRPELPGGDGPLRNRGGHRHGDLAGRVVRSGRQLPDLGLPRASTRPVLPGQARTPGRPSGPPGVSGSTSSPAGRTSSARSSPAREWTVSPESASPARQAAVRCLPTRSATWNARSTTSSTPVTTSSPRRACTSW